MRVNQETSVSIRFETDVPEYLPSDFLSGDYSIRLTPDDEVQAIEASVIWVTEGKGEEDIGVHFFQRRNRNAINQDTLSQPQRFSTVLPASPRTYAGKILKVHWCVRVRLFLVSGHEITKDREFILGRCGIPVSPEVVEDSESN